MSSKKVFLYVPSDDARKVLSLARAKQLTSSSTGATGYIGGDALFAIRHAQPDWRLKVLVRDEEKAAKIRTNLPGVETVMGSLDDFDVIKNSVSGADIVIRKSHCLFLSKPCLHDGNGGFNYVS